MADKQKMTAPVVVVNKGLRYVLTGSGVSLPDPTRHVDHRGVVIGPWSESVRRATALRQR